MGNINKQFEYLGITLPKYNYKDKETNINNMVLYMLNRSNMMFKYHNLPDSLPADNLELILQCNGNATIFKYKNDLYAVQGGLGGEYDVYHRPTISIVAVPYLNYNATLKIHENCVVILNDTMGIGLLPMYYQYCSMINENQITQRLVNINQRVQDFMIASDDSTMESAKLFLKNLEDGTLGVIGDELLFDSFKTSKASNSAQNVMRDLYEYEQYLKGSMYNEIGLAYNYNLKKERVTQAEIQLNTDNLYPLVDDMLKKRREAIEEINELFETNIEVELNSSWDYRIFNGMGIHNTNEETDITQMEEQEQEGIEQEQEGTEQEQEETEQEQEETEQEQEGTEENED